MYHIYARDSIVNYLSNYDNNNKNYDFTNSCITSISTNQGQYNVSVKACFKDTPSSCVYYNIPIVWRDDLGQYIINSTPGATIDPPSCKISTNYVDITDNPLYYPKLDSVMTIFIVIVLVCFWFPYKVFSRAFGRWLKV